MIDYIFNLLINKSEKLSKDFFSLVNRLEFDYQKEMLDSMNQEKVKMVKEIVYILYRLTEEKEYKILDEVKRDDLINLYNNCKKYNTDNFINYYKKAIINKFSNSS